MVKLMEKNNYSGLWIFAEQRKGVLDQTVFELLAKAQELKKVSGEVVTAVLLGSNVSQLTTELIARGADQVIVADNAALEVYSARPYQQALTQLAEKYKPSIILYGATSLGRDLAPRLMVSLNTGLTADAIDLGYDEDGVFYQTTPGYGGKIFAQIVINEKRPQMSTVHPAVFEALDPDYSKTGEVIDETVEVSADEAYVVVSESEKIYNCVPVDKAKILVSGGRGIKNEQQLEQLKELAQLLGGEVCGSRPLVESGLLSPEVQIGQSANTVKPELIINVAVSGAVQYKLGMQDAKHIISINRDKKAPIFGCSDSAAVADFASLVPAIIREIKKRKEKNE